MNHSIFKIISLQIIIILFGFVALTSVSNAANSTKLTTGLFYIDGQSETINSDDVSALSIPLLLSVKQDKLSFGVSVAYMSIESGSLDETGLGDTIVSMGYDLTDSFTLKLKEKFSTGDENKGLSTGKNDTSVQLDYFAKMGNQTSLFTTLGYKTVGKVTGLNMQDTLYASVGTGYVYPTKTSIGVSLDYRESIFKNLDDQLGIAAFVSKPLNSTYSLTGFAGYDDTQTSSLGVSLTTKF
ncbi:hypothetical protein [Thiomicrorhabdus lithotrophica]|uniref:Uncharacterized protein n=1 Tax=Thiomicrorhabdus lithotrophica TaxID=2949997 RepID=A0ABY8CE51_9GAMM|nr:hypothetical protein [Thiomicrorhabdus lithotrophica]WEJ62683.1 hypothetical protein NR989_00125 [Thiomicrorhabdus lithotrophica]